MSRSSTNRLSPFPAAKAAASSVTALAVERLGEGTIAPDPATLRAMRVEAQQYLRSVPPSCVMSGGVIGVRSYKDHCAKLVGFSRGGAFTPAIRAALFQVRAQFGGGAE